MQIYSCSLHIYRLNITSWGFSVKFKHLMYCLVDGVYKFKTTCTLWKAVPERPVTQAKTGLLCCVASLSTAGSPLMASLFFHRWLSVHTLAAFPPMALCG